MSRFARATIAALMLSIGTAWAQDAPVGLWKTIDDQTGKPRSLIRITEENGVLSGRVEKLFRAPGEDPAPVCENCEDTRKGQPIVGMTILSGMRKEGQEYGGGQILDPANGKVYKSKMNLIENGDKLEVRGYIGVPMLGRTQVWERAD